MKEATAPRQDFLSGIGAWSADRLPAGPPWLQKLRRDSAARFRSTGLPGPRDEEWRQTSVAAIAATVFEQGSPTLAPPGGFELPAFCGDGTRRLVFVNGVLSRSLSSAPASLRAGIVAGSLAAALAERPETLEADLTSPAPSNENAFGLLNTAYFADGAYVTAADGVVLDEPLYVVHVSAPGSNPTASLPRSLVRLGRHCRLTLVEVFLSAGDSVSLTGASARIVVGDDSSVTHVRIQDESKSAFHVGSTEYRLGRDSRVHSLQVSFGGELSRYEIGAELTGPGAECTLDGLYLAGAGQHVDHHTTIDHAAPRCASHEMYKGVLAGTSRAVFNGRIIVRPGAQKTDAKQSNRNLLLSGDAVVHTRPQLEIHADDVKCTHGATIGRLDADALFYLRSRGVGLDEARNVLIHAFTAAVLGKEIPAALRTALDAELTRRLAARDGRSA